MACPDAHKRCVIPASGDCAQFKCLILRHLKMLTADLRPAFVHNPNACAVELGEQVPQLLGMHTHTYTHILFVGETLPAPATAATLLLLSPPSLHTALDPTHLANFSALLAWGARAWGIGGASASLGHSALSPYTHDPFVGTPSPVYMPSRAGADAGIASPVELRNGGPGMRRVVEGSNARQSPVSMPFPKAAHGAESGA
eukprot:scaffold144039_cov26-Tisochrysis_lutea.AAC.1